MSKCLKNDQRGESKSNVSNIFPGRYFSLYQREPTLPVPNDSGEETHHKTLFQESIKGLVKVHAIDYLILQQM